MSTGNDEPHRPHSWGKEAVALLIDCPPYKCRSLTDALFGHGLVLEVRRKYSRTPNEDLREGGREGHCKCILDDSRTPYEDLRSSREEERGKE